MMEVRALCDVPERIDCGEIHDIESLGMNCTDLRNIGSAIIEVNLKDGRLICSSRPEPEVASRSSRDDRRSMNVERWTSYVRAARDRHEQNVEAIRDAISGEIRLRTCRFVQNGQELFVWYSEELAREFNIPILNHSNIRGDQQYMCTFCTKLFRFPNPLKAHIRFHCFRSAFTQHRLPHPFLLAPSFPNPCVPPPRAFTPRLLPHIFHQLGSSPNFNRNYFKNGQNFDSSRRKTIENQSLQKRRRLDTKSSFSTLNEFTGKRRKLEITNRSSDIAEDYDAVVKEEELEGEEEVEEEVGGGKECADEDVDVEEDETRENDKEEVEEEKEGRDESILSQSFEAFMPGSMLMHPLAWAMRSRFGLTTPAAAAAAAAATAAAAAAAAANATAANGMSDFSSLIHPLQRWFLSDPRYQRHQQHIHLQQEQQRQLYRQLHQQHQQQQQQDRRQQQLLHLAQYSVPDQLYQYVPDNPPRRNTVVDVPSSTGSENVYGIPSTSKRRRSFRSSHRRPSICAPRPNTIMDTPEVGSSCYRIADTDRNDVEAQPEDLSCNEVVGRKKSGSYSSPDYRRIRRNNGGLGDVFGAGQSDASPPTTTSSNADVEYADQIRGSNYQTGRDKFSFRGDQFSLVSPGSCPRIDDLVNDRHIENDIFITRDLQNQVIQRTHEGRTSSDASGIVGRSAEDGAADRDINVEDVETGGSGSRRGYICVYCGKLYTRKYGLKIHVRTHTGYKPLKCAVCQRPFGDPSNLNKHIRLHAEGETPYRCRHCGKVLVRRRDLERHIRSRHMAELRGGGAHGEGGAVREYEVLERGEADPQVRRIEEEGERVIDGGYGGVLRDAVGDVTSREEAEEMGVMEAREALQDVEERDTCDDVQNRGDVCIEQQQTVTSSDYRSRGEAGEEEEEEKDDNDDLELVDVGREQEQNDIYE